jgi:putative endonuclease
VILKAKLTVGQQAELYARKYLEKQGLIWLASNFSCRVGEIDLIMKTCKSELVFIEVRRRSSEKFGGAAASVTASKQKKIIKTAALYLLKHPTQGQHGVRFDVLAFDGKPARLTWIERAFDADY